jgi:hypothetical protein
MRDVITAYVALDDGRLRSIDDKIIEGLFSGNIAGQGRSFNSGSTPTPALRPDSEQETLSINAFPGPWAAELFDKVSVLTCPVRQDIFSVLPPLRYAKTQDLFVSAEKDKAETQHMQPARLEAAVVYCPFHQIVGFKPDTFCYVNSNTNLTEYFATVHPKLDVLDGIKRQPTIRIEYYGGKRVMPSQQPISSTGLFKEHMKVLLGQNVFVAKQLTEAFALAPSTDEKTQAVCSQLAQQNQMLQTELDKVLTVNGEPPFEPPNEFGNTASDLKAIEAQAEKDRKALDELRKIIEEGDKRTAPR